MLGCYATVDHVSHGDGKYGARWRATTPKHHLTDSFDDEAAALRAAIDRHGYEVRISKLPDRQRVEDVWNRDAEKYEWYHLSRSGERLQGPFSTIGEAIEAAENHAIEAKRELEQALLRYAATAREQRIAGLLIPHHHSGLALETIKPKNDSQREAVRRLASINQNFLVCGPAGTGKTSIAAAALVSFVSKQEELSARFVTVGEIVQLSLAVDEAPLRELRGVAVLVIDAVQAFARGDLEMAVSAMVAKHVRDILLFRCQSENWHTIVVSDGTVQEVRQYLGNQCFGMVFEKLTDSTRHYNRGDVIEFAAKGKTSIAAK
jgi:DNA replication protein DnaC